MGSIEEDDAKEKAAKNQFKLTDVGWVTFHLILLSLDTLAIFRLLQLKGGTSDLLGGQTQFITTWGLAASISSHFFMLYAMIAVDPYPVVYVHRERVKRDNIYDNSARFSALATTLCTAATICHLLLFAAGEQEWDIKPSLNAERWFPALYVVAIVCLDKWICLLFQVPRHWSCGPGRYISRRSRLMELEIGQSGVHVALSTYMTWLLLCRIYNGQWAYSTLWMLEMGSGTGVNHAMQVCAIACSVHMVGWLAWRCAAAVAPKPRL